MYRHSDGYPESVLTDLRDLKIVLESTGTFRGASYAAAQFVFLQKLRAMSFYVQGQSEQGLRAPSPEAMTDPECFIHLDRPSFLLGHGIEDPRNGIHGDEEYLYVVRLPWGGALDGGAEWNVKVSRHRGFPRWDGPTTEAFDRASWQFDGPLSKAIEALVAG